MEHSKQTVTFKRVRNGEFESYLDGVKTPWKIYNGSLGLSGRDTVNTYGITKDGMNVKWLGPLRSCKSMISYTLTKGSR